MARLGPLARTPDGTGDTRKMVSTGAASFGASEATLLLSAAVRDYSDIYFLLSDFVIPAKAGIQVVWIPTMATPGLDARLRGHDGWNVRLVSIKIRHRNYE